MIKRFLRETTQKFRSAVNRGKQKSLAFLPGKFRQGLKRRISLSKNVEDPAYTASGRNTNIDLNTGDSVPLEVDKSVRKKKWSLEQFEVAPVPEKTRFHDIGLPLRLMRAVADLKFSYCTPIQAECLPHLLRGSDLVGNANTGTGKTAVFLITIITNLLKHQPDKAAERLRALIIAPTRELVIQIAKDGRKLARYTKLKIAAVYGGSDYQQQIELLQKGRTDIVVATPGRLLDFARKKVLDLQYVNILVIDEADRMLDMGFIPDVRRIVSLLPDLMDRQTLMFSATITEDVKRLASQWCKNPVNITIEPEQVAVESVDQRVYLVTTQEKYPILYNLIQRTLDARIVVFANLRIEAKKLAERLKRNGIECVLLTGDVPQKKRMDRLERFRSDKVSVLVATDVAGRGIHIEGITHVVNYSLPFEPEDYVHRIGRTGRAGAAGVSISFACEEGGFVLPDIEEFIGRKLECVIPEEDLLKEPPKGQKTKAKHYQGNRRRKRKPRRSANSGKKTTSETTR